MPPVLAAKSEALLSHGAQEEMIGSRASTSVERVCAENKQLLSIKALSLSKWHAILGINGPLAEIVFRHEKSMHLRRHNNCDAWFACLFVYDPDYLFSEQQGLTRPLIYFVALSFWP